MTPRQKKHVISIGLIASLLCVPILAHSQEVQFKRLKVENREPGNLINIQIEPEAELANPETDIIEPVEPSIPSDEAVIAPPSIETGFWATISPALSDASPLSLQNALLAEKELQDYQPRADEIQKIVTDFGKPLLRYGAEMGISPAFLLAVMYVESRGKPKAKSPAGAQGLMQLIPATAERFGVEDAFDPEQSIKGSALYLKFLLEEFNSDALLALAGYNAGENAVLSHSGVPPYEETRNYIPKVVAAWSVARKLCIGPQDYATDGCVFLGMG